VTRPARQLTLIDCFGLGINGKQARRYHWLSEGLKSFVEEPPLRH
jgi:hypothetical protein